jgi:hypothetical protein
VSRAKASILTINAESPPLVEHLLILRYYHQTVFYIIGGLNILNGIAIQDSLPVLLHCKYILAIFDSLFNYCILVYYLLGKVLLLL